MRFRLVLVLVASFSAGCAPEPPDRGLLPLLEPASVPGSPSRVVTVPRARNKLDPRQPHPILLGGSQRRSVITHEGLSWQASVPVPGRPRLDWATAGLDPLDGEIVVEVRTGGSAREVYRARVPSGEWRGHAIDLDGGGDVTLVLRSDRPVAWAEPALTWPGPSSRPSLVLISIDTLRSDRLSCYGYARPTSPSLDRLAADGLLFTQSTSTSTWTLPSTATLLTGLLPDQHQLRTVHDALAPEVRTVAEILRDEGYRTAAFADGGFASFKWGFPQGFQRFDSTSGRAAEPKDVKVITTAADAWLRSNRYEPFFLFLHTYETHSPYTNTEGFADPFLDPAYDGKLVAEAKAWDLTKAAHKKRPADRRRVSDLYDGEVARADHYLGRVLDTLRELGLYDRTAIVVTSDHGEELLEHLGVEHGYGKVFDENVRVPMIFKPPAGTAPAVVATPVNGIDVVPTLLAEAGIEPSPDILGRPLREHVGEGAAARPAERSLLIHGLNSFPNLDEKRYRLDTGTRSLVFDRVRGETAVYDRAADPEMAVPLPAAGDALLDRLAMVLAWASADGKAFSRLPKVRGHLVVPPSSAILPIGVWKDLEWHPVAAGRLTAPSVLVFDVDPTRAGGLALRARLADQVEEVRLRPYRHDDAWSPLAGDLPPARVALPTAEVLGSLDADLDDEARAELEALGYLQ